MQPLEQPIAIMEKAYKNLGYVLLLLIPLTGIAFYKTYFNQFPGFAFEENITPYIHLHAFIASVWIAMLIAQPLLIRNKKMAWHRKIGRLSYVVFPLLLLSFLPQMIRLAHSEHPEFLFFPLGDSVLLVLFYALAIYYRKNPPQAYAVYDRHGHRVFGPDYWPHRAFGVGAVGGFYPEPAIRADLLHPDRPDFVRPQAWKEFSALPLDRVGMGLPHGWLLSGFLKAKSRATKLYARLYNKQWQATCLPS